MRTVFQKLKSRFSIETTTIESATFRTNLTKRQIEMGVENAKIKRILTTNKA